MTADAFAEAARAEAKRSALSDGRTAFTDPSVIEDLLVHMAEWALAHLAAQEPSDAEVEAARKAAADAIDQNVRALVLLSGVTLDQFRDQFPGIRDSLAATASRAALRAARAVRVEA